MLGLGSVEVEASAAEVWSLVAEPERWHEWSPYVAGAEGLGTPEVREGAVGSVVVRGGMRIGAEILEVLPGVSWTWRVRGLRIRHEVDSIPHLAAAASAEGVGKGDSGAQERCRLTMTPSGSGLFWAPAAWAYQVPTALIARNIARVASRPR